MPVECAICLSKLQCEQRLDCQHGFCSDCIGRWLLVNNVCPICIQQVGPTPNNTLSVTPSNPPSPCSDHLLPEQSTLRLRLTHISKLIQTKREYGQKSCFSASRLSSLTEKLYQAEQMFDLFSALVEQGAPMNEAVSVMEAVHLMAIELEGELEGGAVRGTEQLHWQMEQEDEEDMFPEICVKVVESKRSKNKGRKRGSAK